MRAGGVRGRLPPSRPFPKLSLVHLRILYHGNCLDGCSSAGLFMRFFRERITPGQLVDVGGLNNDEIAGVLKISKNTVIRDWNMARAWLHSQLAGSASN